MEKFIMDALLSNSNRHCSKLFIKTHETKSEQIIMNCKGYFGMYYKFEENMITKY